ncbi:hypothetical protein GUJ93_ZPchr0006g43305 [Zizania palustris]|uniref:PGG domain-containing protein n=1 Tax=Zizania palustris TaxID=103762 RepID=A0A8J5TCC1_ZIZPA|nr:hypothetical protein GUJ93_ZPchr0006g43305 [Zizania palustris]
MSGQLEAYSSEGRAAPVVDVAPGDAAPVAATEVSSTGKRGIPVLIAPYPPRDGRQGAPDARAAFEGFLVFQEDDNDTVTAGKKWLKEMRGWLMVLTTVAASVTYQAGINPPGGFWQDDKDGHTAGNPVMHDKFKARYKTFYYFNSTALVTSLVITVLLMSERFYRSEIKVLTLILATVVDLASLVGAYIAGSTRFTSSGIYVIVITCVAFVCVIFMGEVLGQICGFFHIKSPCMLKWFPVPREVVDRAIRQRGTPRRMAQAAAPASNKQRPCCLCCAATPTTGDV